MALAYGEHLARVAIGDGMSQSGIAVSFRVNEAQRAHAGGGVPHPCAHAVEAGGFVLFGGQGQGKGVVAPLDGDGQRLPAAGFHLLGQAVDGVHRLTCDLGDQVTGLDTGQPGGAGKAAQVAGAHHQHALGVQRHAHGLTAGIEGQVIPDIDGYLTQWKQPKQADGGCGCLWIHLREGLPGVGIRRQRGALQVDFQGEGCGQVHLLPGGDGQGIRQGTQQGGLGREMHHQQHRGQQPAGDPAGTGGRTEKHEKTPLSVFCSRSIVHRKRRFQLWK